MIWKRTPLGIALALALVLALSACAAGSPPAQSATPTTTAPTTAAPTVEATPSPQPEATATPTPTPDAPAQGNVLVAYFSHMGNTEAVAEQIAERTGGTLAQIQWAEEYADLQQEAEAEILQGVRPEITVSVDNVEEYDTIFVGYPIWWDEAPAMIATFLESLRLFRQDDRALLHERERFHRQQPAHLFGALPGGGHRRGADRQ